MVQSNKHSTRTTVTSGIDFGAKSLCSILPMSDNRIPTVSGQNRHRRQRSTLSPTQTSLTAAGDPASLSSILAASDDPYGRFSPYAQHRTGNTTGNSRDDESLEMSIHATLRELDGENTALRSALEQPLPRLIAGDGDETFLQLADGSSEMIGRSKRRKLDGDPLAASIPSYGCEGKIVPGRLKMQIEACGTGPYGAAMIPTHDGSNIRNILNQDNTVFSGDATRCSLMLSHSANLTFSVKQVVIKSPVTGYDARVQEGLIFIAMDREDMHYRTERYDLARDEMNRRSTGQRHRSTRSHYPSARSIRVGHDNSNEPAPAVLPPLNQRRNSWQQAQQSLVSTSSTPGPTDGDPSGEPSSPSLPYAPIYLDFRTDASSQEAEIVPRGGGRDWPIESDQSSRSFLDDLYNRITLRSRRLDHQRATMTTSQGDQNYAGPPISDQIRQRISDNESNNPNIQGTGRVELILGQTGSDSDSSSDDESEIQDSDRTTGRRRIVLPSFRLNLDEPDANHPVARNPLVSANEFLQESLQVNEYANVYRMMRRRHQDRAWWHSDQYRCISEPRSIEWVPNKVNREGLSSGPSGMPSHMAATQGQTRSYLPSISEKDGSQETPLRPHARFFIERDAEAVTINFDPPAAGKYILLKMWAPPGADSIDLQEVAVYGYAGPRLFQKVEFR